ncbi:putative membrane protein [[Clostridium] bifermentans ATCC 638]|uniref:Putative membrane protein n=1 Tax=Paraclostridium bifermentans ATCC 638 = DSM 14991 TaxID=1233171 RepID=T4VQ43_PARBF|nr:hypothetical protein [Paraclostridium bifermentans]EQK42881.1 putative membrane protein [[Clostridium] bifermentans ATCC 638] [Paraclostridium bifermentans ATCC 638 = DSM 14991]RIZ58013.1 hypothetical protein CHH45_13270 [Paraclostridium bifermentans]UAG16767.1 hypothetical protein KXZ80_08165 [Paraclostridium bifermentans]
MLAGDASFLYSGNRYIVGTGVGFVSSVYENIKSPTLSEFFVLLKLITLNFLVIEIFIMISLVVS